MAFDSNDIMTLKALENGMTPYEQIKVANMQSKNRVSGVGIAGLVTGSVGIITGIAAILWAGARSNGIKYYAEAKHDGLRDLVLANAQTLAAERAERIAGDINVTTTINDTLSGSQQGSLSAYQQASLEANQQVMTGLMTGRYSENPQKVELMSPATPFQCGCGCGN